MEALGEPSTWCSSRCRSTGSVPVTPHAGPLTLLMEALEMTVCNSRTTDDNPMQPTSHAQRTRAAVKRTAGTGVATIWAQYLSGPRPGAETPINHPGGL